MLKALKRFKGGIHPPAMKRTENLETVVMPIPTLVTIPMRQHIGAECIPTVKKGDHVDVGQVIGQSDAPLSVPIHASVSGRVEAVKPAPSASGQHLLSVVIRADGKQTPWEGLKPVETEDPEQMIQAVRASGLVGLGGAGFPTYFKLKPPPGDTFDVLLINGAECEPYITSDFREMVENPMGVIHGVELVLKMTGIPRAIIGVEDNKQQAIDRLIKAAEHNPQIDVMKLRTRYPQGGEKQLIYAATGRRIGPGKLPSSQGVLVLSINTVSGIAEYFQTGMPLVRRRVTIDGDAIREPKNVLVPIGIHLQDIFRFCGGFCATPASVIMGGPMMGVAQFSPENTILKQTNAVLVLTDKVVHREQQDPCIRCGMCVDHCPMQLLPFQLNALVLHERYDEAAKLNLMNCIECGCCSYVCPASRFLVQSFRFGKSALRRQSNMTALKENAEMALHAMAASAAQDRERQGQESARQEPPAKQESPARAETNQQEAPAKVPEKEAPKA